MKKIAAVTLFALALAGCEVGIRSPVAVRSPITVRPYGEPAYDHRVERPRRKVVVHRYVERRGRRGRF
jgi:hypothetical protein